MRKGFTRIAILLIVVLLLVEFQGLCPVSAKKNQSMKEIETKVEEIDPKFTVQELSYRINETVCSARSNKLYAQLCKIDGKYQILYSKNGKKLSKSDIEGKLRKELNIPDKEIIECYYMTQFDGVFYICAKYYPTGKKQLDYRAPEDDSYEYDYIQYYVAETKDFKKYTTHFMVSRSKENIYMSEIDFRSNPKLYKISGNFYFMFDEITKKVNVEDDGLYLVKYSKYLSKKNGEDDDDEIDESLHYCKLDDPIGYYGKSLDSMGWLEFEEIIDYDPEIYKDGLTLELKYYFKKDKLYLLVALNHDESIMLYIDTDDKDRIDSMTNNEMVTYEGSIDSDGSIDEWDLVSIDGMSWINGGAYEQFYTIGWNDDKYFYGVTGVNGTDTCYEISFPLGEYLEGIGYSDLYSAYKLAYYGMAVGAKKNKKGALSVKNTVFIPVLHKQAYTMDSKGNISKVKLPFNNEYYEGLTASITQKGWSVIVAEWAMFISSDGFKTCKKVYLPCGSDFVDIESYGNYLYVLAENRAYRLPLSALK